jgi:hypothetical protein
MSILHVRRPRPKQIAFFGCSITYGDGLDNIDYHTFRESGLDEEDDLNRYRLNNSYPGVLAKMLDCSYENLAIKSNSNERILRDAYDYCVHLENLGNADLSNLLVVVQTTFYSRRLIYHIDSNTEYSLNSHVEIPNIPPVITNQYKNYILHCYDHSREFDIINRQVNLLKTWFQSKKIQYIFLGYDAYSKLPEPYFNSPDTASGSIQEFANKYKLLIKDVTNMQVNDYHLNEQGHHALAVLLKDYIQNNYGNKI